MAVLYSQLVVDNAAASGDTTLIAGEAGFTIRVWGLFFVTGADTEVSFKSDATAMSGPLSMLANGAFSLDVSPTQPWFTCGTGEALIINSSTASQVGGTLYYTRG